METRQHKQITLAQNFLRSPKLVHYLVRMSSISVSDTVYEIGPGNGILTAALARAAGQVIAIEKDPDLVRRLRERFRLVQNIEIVEQDVLNYSFRTRLRPGASSGAKCKLFANIPFNCTAQIVRKILHDRCSPCESFLIMQKEAARKFSGFPRETLFSILHKPFFDLKILLSLKRTDFSPIPNVDPVLLSIRRRATPLIEAEDVALYRRFVQYGYERWKPNLRLAFKNVFTYQQWKRLGREFRFSLNATPSDLSVEQWLGLYREFKLITPKALANFSAGLERPRQPWEPNIR